ncbi:PLD nuclease N-terminal domain-containing protein [Paenarthrobacter ureafaciens]|uniref:PLD nuclease N-terminal domain-containing protein n=1 Tax=Paenarthrobacter ureafaciens TaxID=37931 RepID=UPI00374391CD
MGSVVWGVFDVIRDDRLDHTATALWVLLLFVVPLFGIIAWLYARPRLGGQSDGLSLRTRL